MALAVIGTLAAASPAPGHHGRITDFLGETIGSLFVDPKTTTQLVALTGQRLGSVSRHLRILRAAGLFERRRVGRSVLYYRSPAGDLLVRIQNEAGLLCPDPIYA